MGSVMMMMGVDDVDVDVDVEVELKLELAGRIVSQPKSGEIINKLILVKKAFSTMGANRF